MRIRTELRYVYFASAFAVIGVTLLATGFVFDMRVLESFGVAFVGGVLVGLGFHVASSADLSQLRAVLTKDLQEVSHEARALAEDLDIARTSERLGLVAIFDSRRDQRFEDEVRKRIAEASELWIQGITSNDFFGPGKPFYDVTREFVSRGGKLHALILHPDSTDFEFRRRMNQPNIEDRLRSQLYLDHLSTLSTLSEWGQSLSERMTVGLTSGHPLSWVLRTDRAVLIQQYHYGYPQGGAHPDGGYRSVSHDFPVFEFDESSRHHATLSSHLSQAMEHLAPGGRPRVYYNNLIDSVPDIVRAIQEHHAEYSNETPLRVALVGMRLNTIRTCVDKLLSDLGDLKEIATRVIFEVYHIDEDFARQWADSHGLDADRQIDELRGNVEYLDQAFAIRARDYKYRRIAYRAEPVFFGAIIGESDLVWGPFHWNEELERFVGPENNECVLFNASDRFFPILYAYSVSRCSLYVRSQEDPGEEIRHDGEPSQG